VLAMADLGYEEVSPGPDSATPTSATFVFAAGSTFYEHLGAALA